MHDSNKNLKSHRILKVSEVLTAIEDKIEALETYISTGEAAFDIPKLFSLNWLIKLKTDSLEGFSKSSKIYKQKKDIINDTLKACEKRRKDDEDRNGTCTLKNEIKTLKGEVGRLKRITVGLASDNQELLQKITELENTHKVHQARFRDTASVHKFKS